MSEQKSVKDLPACPVETTLTLIGDKWKVLILRDLMPGTKRFGQWRRADCLPARSMPRYLHEWSTH